MYNKYKKILKIIVILCIIVLFIDIFYLIYMKINNKNNVINFDSINSFEILEDGFIAIGSNNKNKDLYEKPKITKYDKNYKKVWEKIYNKKYNGSYFGVKKDGDYYIAVGDYESSKTEHNDKVRSALIVKYDLEGNIIKEKKFQLLGNSKFTNIIVVEGGYIVVGQSIYENMTLGLSDEGGAFIIKYDKDLNELWKSNYGGSKSGIYNDVIKVDDYFYAVGKDSVRTGIVSKYDINGKIIKTINYDNTDTIGFTSIVNIDQYLYVIGSKKISDKKDDTEALIVKYDLDLNKINENTYNDEGIQRYNKAIVDDNNIIVAGQSGIEKSNNYTYKGIFAKYNKNLNELMIKEYDNNKDNYFTDIKKLNDDYIISGYYKNKQNNYLSKFTIYTPKGKVIGEKE